MELQTFYSIREISPDGLLKIPIEEVHGGTYPIFLSEYSSMEEVDTAISEHGQDLTNYVVLTMKRKEDLED